MGTYSAVLCIVLALTGWSYVTAQYEVPSPTIEALYPKGLRVSIPDSEGVQLFAFHGNVNKPMYSLEAGEMSVDIIKSKDGRWTYVNSQKRLKLGDTINYWLYVQVDGLGYRLDDQTFQVTELIDPSTGRPVGTLNQDSQYTSYPNRPTETPFQNRPPPYNGNPNTPSVYPQKPRPYPNNPFIHATTTPPPYVNNQQTQYPNNQYENPIQYPNTFGNQSSNQNQQPDYPLNLSPRPNPLESPSTGDRFTGQSIPTTQDCVLSKTTVNGKTACKGEVVFDERWTALDRRRWEHDVNIPGHPDYEFCIFAQHQQNSWVSDGALHLKPTLTEDKYGADFVRKGKLQLDDCTAGPANSDGCTREAKFSYILPPTLGARLNTRHSFNFKYGVVEVRAKLPQGDWIYPELLLQPRNNEYGPGLSSGRVILAMARGNRDLRSSSGEDISGRRLETGVLAGGSGVGSAGARKKFFHRETQRGDGPWADQFHNYTLLWTPETLAFSVDGVELGVARPETFGGLIHSEGDRDPWELGSRIAPFDKEFYISLGVAVGGIHAFPDECRSSNGVEKPWKNTAPKAMLGFWNAKDSWYPTWRENSQLVIESVKVTALNN